MIKRRKLERNLQFRNKLSIDKIKNYIIGKFKIKESQKQVILTDFAKLKKLFVSPVTIFDEPKREK